VTGVWAAFLTLPLNRVAGTVQFELMGAKRQIAKISPLPERTHDGFSQHSALYSPSGKVLPKTVLSKIL
jgi:hypothetical protein